MNVTELIFIALGLSMDAFAAAVCKGLRMTRGLNFRQGIIVAIYFGGFQAGMPFLGWFLGRWFQDSIIQYNHWIAFVLLLLIGGNMIREALLEDDVLETCDFDDMKLNYRDLTLMAIATSIDALAVGVTFAFLRVKILPAIAYIGSITFLISYLGVLIGNRFGEKYKSKAELAGGIILILMGCRILLEHL